MSIHRSATLILCLAMMSGCAGPTAPAPIPAPAPVAQRDDDFGPFTRELHSNVHWLGVAKDQNLITEAEYQTGVRAAVGECLKEARIMSFHLSGENLYDDLAAAKRFHSDGIFTDQDYAKFRSMMMKRFDLMVASLPPETAIHSSSAPDGR